MKNKNKKLFKQVGTDDDYWMELADEKANPGTSVIKKSKKELKMIDKRSFSFGSFRETFG